MYVYPVESDQVYWLFCKIWANAKAVHHFNSETKNKTTLKDALKVLAWKQKVKYSMGKCYLVFHFYKFL